MGIKSPGTLVTLGMSLPLPISHYEMECSLSLLEILGHQDLTQYNKVCLLRFTPSVVV